MQEFKVMAVSLEEYAKAELDPNYAPEEHEVGTIRAVSADEADTKLARMIRKGTMPRGSMIVEE